MHPTISSIRKIFFAGFGSQMKATARARARAKGRSKGRSSAVVLAAARELAEVRAKKRAKETTKPSDWLGRALYPPDTPCTYRHLLTRQNKN